MSKFLKKKKKIFERRIHRKKHFFLPGGTAKIYLNKSNSNVFLTLTDLYNRVIVCRSSGNSGIRGSKRMKTAYHSIEMIFSKLLIHIKLYRILNIWLVLKMKKTTFFSYLLKELLYNNIQVKFMNFARATAFNGVRGRKLRRT